VRRIPAARNILYTNVETTNGVALPSKAYYLLSKRPCFPVEPRDRRIRYHYKSQKQELRVYTVESFGGSKPVSSNQTSPHKDLEVLINRYSKAVDRTPINEFTYEVFEHIRQKVADTQLPLWLDSFCGTGLSTRYFAQQNANYCVIGVDQSSVRLQAEPEPEGENYLLIRGECEGLWRLMAQEGFCTSVHTLLYPNPWPKSQHIKRRVHGNAAFQSLLQVSPYIELRTNWEIYALEFERALMLSHRSAHRRAFEIERAVTRFEEKYRASGHTLWQVTSDARDVSV